MKNKERSVKSSPAQSDDLRNLEADIRTALPLVVETSPRAVVKAEMVTIEEEPRTLLVDIVRSCRSAVAQVLSF